LTASSRAAPYWLNAEVAQKLPVENFLNLHRRLNDLRAVCELLPKAEVLARARGASEEEFAQAYEGIVHRGEQFPDFGPMLRLVGALGKSFANGASRPWPAGK
jgi:hypothetical protein